jgi:hypothetical protein
MRGATLIQVVGPPGGGKTTLIERLLRSYRSRLLAAVRVVPDAAVRVPVLDAVGDGETARYAAAGAWSSQRVLVPESGRRDVLDALEACAGATYPASAILIEGGRSLRGVAGPRLPAPAGGDRTAPGLRGPGRGAPRQGPWRRSTGSPSAAAACAIRGFVVRHERLEPVAGHARGGDVDRVEGPQALAAGQGAGVFEQLARDVDEIEAREDLAGGGDGLVADEVGGPQQFGVGERAGEADRAGPGREVGTEAFGLGLEGDQLREGEVSR